MYKHRLRVHRCVNSNAQVSQSKTWRAADGFVFATQATAVQASAVQASAMQTSAAEASAAQASAVEESADDEENSSA